jgi:hypothetical protein
MRTQGNVMSFGFQPYSEITSVMEKKIEVQYFKGQASEQRRPCKLAKHFFHKVHVSRTEYPWVSNDER